MIKLLVSLHQDTLGGERNNCKSLKISGHFFKLFSQPVLIFYSLCETQMHSSHPEQLPPVSNTSIQKLGL